MKAYAFFLLLCMTCQSGFTQIYRVTFTGTGDADRIDWIKATNLNSEESMTIHGPETLYLEVIWPNLTSAGSGTLGNDCGMIYPNPFKGNVTLLVNVTMPQKVCVAVRNL